tara:strand:+ start:5694 stop:5852 length:159 start_codon:yes stop_codon:yes gene_type:complete
MEITSNNKFELLAVAERLRTTHFAPTDYDDCMIKIQNGTYTTCEQVEAHPVK